MALTFRSGNLAIGALELKKSYQKNLFLGLTFAAGLHLALIGGILTYQTLNRAGFEGIKSLPLGPVEIGPPPSITKERQPQIEIAVPPMAPPELGIPSPVPDAAATPEVQFPTQSQLNILAPPTENENLGPGAFQVPVSLPPGPEDFVAVEDWPKVIQKVIPLYPDLARRAGVTGEVLLRVLVDKKGVVRDVIVLKPSSSTVGFEEAAKEAVRLWTFSPGIQNGQPVDVWVNVPVRFEIR